MNFYSWDNHSTLKRKTGGGKARLDVSYFLGKKGYKSLKYYNSQNIYLKFILLTINFILFPFLVKNGSVLFVQYPHNIGQRNILKFYKNIKNIRTIFLVHDLESIRVESDKKIENLDLKFCDYIISLNSSLSSYIKNELDVKDKEIVNLDLWDYHVDDVSSHIIEIDLTEDSEKYKCNILIAGNLDKRKAGYLDQLEKIQDVRFYLMGENLDKTIELKENVKYLGSFNSDTRVKCSEGTIFGLVWDGNSIETCSGSYGEYLRKNLPHKTSFYLSNKIPVVVWDQAAILHQIEKKECGFGIANLEELMYLKEAQTKYSQKSVVNESRNIRMGVYIYNAIKSLKIY